jgi:UDP-N-acetylglucosamine 2-epimerase (non-hydrolysing)
MRRSFVTGNTIVDAVHQNLEIAERRASVLDRFGVERGGYFLATVHRQENVDDERRFRGIMEGLELVKKEFRNPHPISHPSQGEEKA